MTTPKPLRLWPGVAAVAFQWIVRYFVPIIFPDALEFAILGALAAALLIIVWWAFFSRAPIVERWGAIVLMIGAMALTPRILHPSVATGMMGMMFYILAIPVMCVAFVAWAVATRRLSNPVRRATLVATILLVCGGWAMVRTNGITGDASSDIAWRWSPTSEERLLVHASDKPAMKIAEEPAPITPPAVVKTSAKRAPTAAAIAITAPVIGPDWPGFRGPLRNDVIPGVQIETDWSRSPPVQLWRKPIGPGWSSFAVHGGYFYTQEQRGNDEVVSCYKLTTGEPVWTHRDAARFWESNAGPGPRATPTLSKGRVYTFGATGILNALDAGNGAVLWSRNAGSDSGTKIPEWGFASSPVVADDVVIVAASGKLAAYNVSNGEPRWFGADGGGGYSSPHLATLGGVEQVLLIGGKTVSSVSPSDGAKLWDHALPPSAPIVQPALTADGDLLISEGEGQGIHRLAVAHGPTGWTVEERWKSIGLKPYFSDFVVHNGHAFGFDGSILSSIDLKDGKRVWKGGRYGSGQLVLLPDQDLLLVLSEEGELALVAASTDQFKELARFPALEGKTWNHPVLVGDVLLVRNGQEMVGFRLKARQ